VTFVKANNTGPGYVPASRITPVQIATDFCEKLFDSLQQYVKSNHLSNRFTTCTTTLAALGGKVAQTADDWNTQLGFAGTNLNPDNAPQVGLVGHD
jgi:hypothetical protein